MSIAGIDYIASIRRSTVLYYEETTLKLFDNWAIFYWSRERDTKGANSL